jgi:hypothetical protein
MLRLRHILCVYAIGGILIIGQSRNTTELHEENSQHFRGVALIGTGTNQNIWFGHYTISIGAFSDL